MMDRESPSASDSEEDPRGVDRPGGDDRDHGSPLERSACLCPVYLEDVNDRGVVMLVTRHRDQNQFSRYFYPWSVVGWIRLAEEDEREEEPRAAGSS